MKSGILNSKGDVFLLFRNAIGGVQLSQQQWRQLFIGADLQLYNTHTTRIDVMYVLLISLTVSFYTIQYILNGQDIHKIAQFEQVLIIIATGCLVALTMIALVWYTQHLQHTQRAFTLILLSFSLILAQYVQQERVEAQMSLYPGAAAIYNQITPREDIPFYQSYEELLRDRPSIYQYEECQAMYLVEVRKCSYGELHNPKYVVALVAGSHSVHWFPALEPISRQLNFRLDVYNHDGCRFTDEDPDDHLTPQCIEWNANLMDILIEQRPDLVFTTASLNKRDYVPAGYIGQWERLEGISTIFAIRDTPRMNESVPSCLVEHDNDVLKCSMPRDEALSAVLPWENTPGLPSNVIYADLSDYFCDETTCYSVIGNVVVYRDQHHLTASYVKTLVPVLRPLIDDALQATTKKTVR